MLPRCRKRKARVTDSAIGHSKDYQLNALSRNLDHQLSLEMCLKTAGRDDFEEIYDQIENATKTLMTTISAFASRPPPEAELKSPQLTSGERYAVRQLREAVARAQTRQDQTKSSPDIDGLEDFAAAFGLTISANNVALWEPTKLAVRDTYNRSEIFDAE